MKLGRLAVAAAAVFVSVGVFSGCVTFNGLPTVKQAGKTKPKVYVAFKICRSGGEGDLCPDPSSSGDALHRVLVGLRVPRGTRAPRRFSPKAINSSTFEGDLKFSKEFSYTSELNEKAPRSNRFRYFGYVSDQAVDPDEVGFNDSARFRIPLRVPKRLVGKRFGVRPVLGVYQVTEQQPVDAPIVCSEDPFDGVAGGGPSGDGTSVCIDAPAKAGFRNITVRLKKRR